MIGHLYYTINEPYTKEWIQFSISIGDYSIKDIKLDMVNTLRYQGPELKGIDCTISCRDITITANMQKKILDNNLNVLETYTKSFTYLAEDFSAVDSLSIIDAINGVNNLNYENN